MGESQSLNELFRVAVSAIDAGDITELDRLIAAHPTLVRDRLDSPGPWLRDKAGNALDSFFQRPYLLWFIAEDPVRNGALPPDIALVTQAIINAARRAGAEHLQEQLDYALRLVSWSWIARQCGVQIALIDVLVDAGPSADGNPDNALVNNNFAAAAHLVARGAPLTLSTALCLERWSDVSRLARTATARQKQFALILSALKGNAVALGRVVDLGVDMNEVSPDLYSHASRFITQCRRDRSKPSGFSSTRARTCAHATRCIGAPRGTGPSTRPGNHNTMKSLRTCASAGAE